ncbi:MAG: S8/S53 family peptidase [Alphaproteobacteria bacterium]|nr:S8/S53 family peptidase [Alphaproteobacteria bacterium]
MNNYIKKFYHAITSLKQKNAAQQGVQYIKVHSIDEIKDAHILDYHDLSELDLREYKHLFDYAPTESLPCSGIRGWTTNVIWPSPDKMPAGVNPLAIMERAKAPAGKPNGATGRGINIAVIDNMLDATNPEYADSIKFIQGPLHDQKMPQNKHASMVMGQLVGKSTGIAPDANVYYFTKVSYQDRKKFDKDITQILKNVIDFNRAQKPENKINILSCSWGARKKHSPEVCALLDQLESDGVKIILCTSDYMNAATLSGRDFMPCNNPNMTNIQPNVRAAGDETIRMMNLPFGPDKRIGIPTNMRTTPLESNGWQYRVAGGESSAAPYIAGVYACVLENNQLFMIRKNWQQELNDILKSTAIQTEQGDYVINPNGVRAKVSEIVKQMEATIIKYQMHQNDDY